MHPSFGLAFHTLSRSAPPAPPLRKGWAGGGARGVDFFCGLVNIRESKQASTGSFMPETVHGFCTLHRIAYNRELDPTCPQCVIAGHLPADQLDFDAQAKVPLNDAGKHL